MSVTVRIPTQLRTFTEGASEVEASGATIDDLVAECEGTRHHGAHRRRGQSAAH